jgi:hypothetical protein
MMAAKGFFESQADKKKSGITVKSVVEKRLSGVYSPCNTIFNCRRQVFIDNWRVFQGILTSLPAGC